MQIKKSQYTIFTAIIILALIEGILYINLHNNYVSLNSSYKILKDRHDHLKSLYAEVRYCLQDLNNSYIKLLEFYFKDEYGDVTVEQAKSLIEERSELVIVDVRTLVEYRESHIEGAINVCVGCKPEDILNYVNPDDEILLYCERGYRSVIAFRILFENGYSKIYNMQGGIAAWIKAGYPVEEG